MSGSISSRCMPIASRPKRFQSSNLFGFDDGIAEVDIAEHDQ